MKLHTVASSNAEQSSNFSFGITGNSSYLTPHIIVDASQVRPNEDDKGEEKGQTQPQRQEQASHKTQPAGMEMQQRANDQRNAANGKESQQFTNKAQLRLKDRKTVNKEKQIQQTKATGQPWISKAISQRSPTTSLGMTLTLK